MGKDKVPFAGAVLRCLGLLFHYILYVPHVVKIVLEIPERKLDIIALHRNGFKHL